jgi:Raf kinase inhibitor-like YbhB/YbcL family protein
MSVALMRLPAVAIVAVCVVCSCSGTATGSEQPGGPEGKGTTTMAITVTSTAFGEGELIPKKHTGDGPDVSPPLAWQGIPDGTKSIALICDDPDAPKATWVHWVIYNLPATASGLPEGVPKGRTLADGSRQGTNDSKRSGYNGPYPPSGVHRYYFKVYALDVALTDPPGITKAQLLKAMEGHIIGQGQLMGKYQRQK